jgi:ribosomal protein L11 methyltransferase
MQYMKISFPIEDSSAREILIAGLADAGFEGFEETDAQLVAYIPESDFDETILPQMISENNIIYTIETIPEQNWNAQWEEHFQPVVVEDFCTVRADFHTIVVNTRFEITITPKMSFGTGHHATTQLMMLQMRDIDFDKKTVLDFGTGTGILAILARMLDANDVLAIDNDEWSYQNALENVDRNQQEHIQVIQSSLDGVEEQQFDIILANINRHILLQYMHAFPVILKTTGQILMSGLLIADKDVVLSAATPAGLKLINESELNGWISLLFSK